MKTMFIVYASLFGKTNPDYEDVISESIGREDYGTAIDLSTREKSISWIFYTKEEAYSAASKVKSFDKVNQVHVDVIVI